MSLKLYHHPVSTCSQKVRIALAEKNLTFHQHVIDWSRLEHLSDWYLAINQNGVVPTLVHDDRPIPDSSVICEYVDEVFPEPAIAPRNPIDRALMRAWMRYFEEVPTVAIRMPSFNKLFAKSIKGRSDKDFEVMTEKMPLRKHFYRQMTEANGFPEHLVAESVEKLRKCLGRVSTALSDGRPFLMGDSYTIADIVLVPTVVRMEDIGLADVWRDLPAIANWFARIQARPSFDVAYVSGSRVNPASYVISQGFPATA